MEKSMIKQRGESLKNAPFYQQWFYHGKQWLYRGRRPNWIAKFLNGMWARTASKSVMSNGLVALEVVGRKSGRIVSFPLVMVTVDGQRYLASMLGDNTQWVRNVRASGGKAVLRSGGREEVQLEEIPAGERAPLLKAYLQVAREHGRTCPLTKMRRLRNSKRSRQILLSSDWFPPRRYNQ